MKIKKNYLKQVDQNGTYLQNFLATSIPARDIDLAQILTPSTRLR